MKVVVDKGIKSIQEIISLLNGFDAIELIFFNSSDIKNSNIKDADVLLVRSTVKVDELLLAGYQYKINWISDCWNRSYRHGLSK